MEYISEMDLKNGRLMRGKFDNSPEHPEMYRETSIFLYSSTKDRSIATPAGSIWTKAEKSRINTFNYKKIKFYILKNTSFSLFHSDQLKLLLISILNSLFNIDLSLVKILTPFSKLKHLENTLWPKEHKNGNIIRIYKLFFTNNY